MTIKINDKEYPLVMNMLAVKKYKQLTGKNLIAQNSLTDILGSEKEGKDFDAELFVSFIYSCMVNGSHPNPLDLSIDDVAAKINLNDADLAYSVSNVWSVGQTGKTVDQLQEIVKNQSAPQQTGQVN